MVSAGEPIAKAATAKPAAIATTIPIKLPHMADYGGYDWVSTEPARSWVEPRSRTSQADRETLFVPSTSRVDVSRKLNADERPR